MLKPSFASHWLQVGSFHSIALVMKALMVKKGSFRGLYKGLLQLRGIMRLSTMVLNHWNRVLRCIWSY